MRRYKYQLKLLIAHLRLLSFFSVSKKNTVGGQALIEGVMMRGKEKVSWAVRKQSGETVIESFPFVSITKKNVIWGIPIIRGVINLFESLNWGYRALSRSADIAMEEEESGDKVAENLENPAKSHNPKKPWADQLFFAANMLVALAVSVALFMYAPMWVANRTPIIKDEPMMFNLMAGTIRISLFLIYISLISLWSEMRRVFEYHGAEHKTIFAYEDNKELTRANIEPYSTVHPRCGTSFLILVALCSILLFSIIDTLYIQYLGNFINLFHRLGVHLVMIPIVAGTSYEALKLSDKYSHIPIVGHLIKPGLWLQKITTRKPDGSQIDVAVKALEAAL